MAVPLKDDASPEYDVGVFIALKEEFRAFQEQVGDQLRKIEVPDSHEQYYGFTRVVGHRTYSCIATVGGQMGEARASRVVDRMIRDFAPKTIIVVGIAGALDKDLRLADVVVADSVESYLEAAKAIPPRETGGVWLRLLRFFGDKRNPSSLDNGDGFEIKLAGEPYRTSSVLKHAIDNLEFSKKSQFRQWASEGGRDLEDTVRSIGTAKSSEHFRNNPEVMCGPIASGPIVGTATGFAQLLKAKNRKLLALEMESGGALGSVHEQATSPRTVVIRGISDFADQRKSELDALGAGAVRKLAMRNAVRLLFCAIDSGLFDTDGAQVPSLNLVGNTPSKGGAAGGSCRVEGFEEKTVGLHIDSCSTLIRSLKEHFGFVWEQSSYGGEAPVVFWPVRLRKPTPIHALQTFAAAAISKQGGHVILCIDDLGNKDYTVASFVNAAKRWWLKVGMVGEFEQRLFSNIVDSVSEDGADFDPWPIVQMWLGKTDKRVLELLRIAKIVKPEETNESSLQLLDGRRPRRLLNPAVIWACLAQIIKQHPNRPVITLGGFDERPLWEAWRNGIVQPDASVGHLYNSCLGVTPLHMSSENLGWDSYDDIMVSLKKDIDRDPAGWLTQGRMVPWCLSGCVELPDFVRSDCSLIPRISVPTTCDINAVLPALARALDERLLGVGIPTG